MVMRWAWRSRSSTTCSTSTGDEAKLGKRVNKDSGLGKWTYPGLLGVEGSRSRARGLADEAVAALAPFGDRGTTLRALAMDLTGKGPLMSRNLLAKIHSPADLKGLDDEQLELLAAEMREELDRRRQPPARPLRQQPRRRRALPGPPPDVRLLPATA